MNWAYIAGFFDGEGNVSIPLGHSSIILNITQAGKRGKETLEEIVDFLKIYGVIAKIRPRNKIVNRQQCYMLWVRPTTACLFLRFVLPYLRVKRTISQDVLRAKVLFPSLTTSTQGQLFRQELAAKANAPRVKGTCLRGHTYTIGKHRKWCRECLKLAYRNKSSNKTVDKSNG